MMVKYWTALAHAMHHGNVSAHQLALTKVPQVNHCVCQRLERVVQLAEAVKPEQQTPELVFPGMPHDLFKTAR